MILSKLKKSLIICDVIKIGGYTVVVDDYMRTHLPEKIMVDGNGNGNYFSFLVDGLGDISYDEDLSTYECENVDIQLFQLNPL